MDIEKLIREYIEKTEHLSLATVKDNKPWVCELHFAYDDGLNLYFRSLTASRHSQELADNPSVAGNIVKQHALGESGKGVCFEGSVKLLDSDDEVNKAFRCIKERLKTGDDILEIAKQEDGYKFYKISVDTFYLVGAFDDRPFQRYELSWHGSKNE